MLVIRLRRIGKKNKPHYRVVVAEHTAAANGKFIADLGFYNPHTKEFKINVEATVDRLNNGAKPSNTLAKLLDKAKVKHASVVVVKKTKKSKKEAEAPKSEPAVKVEAEVATEETPATAQNEEQAHQADQDPKETAEKNN